MFYLLVIVILAVYLYYTRTFNYWNKKGVKYDRPYFLVGTNVNNYLLRKNITQQSEIIYWKYPDEKVVGFYRGWRPELVIRDPEIIKQIFTSDFLYFHNRGLNQHEEVEPLLRNLFFVEGDLWKLLRQRTTPAFTTSKLKSMLPILVECTDRLKQRLSFAVNDGSVIDARELMACFTTDFICAIGFDVDSGALKNNEAHFRKIGLKIFCSTLRDLAVIAFKDMMPEITGSLMTFSSEIERNFFSLINNSLKIKSESTSTKRDFMDLLFDCYKTGPMVGDSIDKLRSDGCPETISQDMDKALMASQAFIFFAAGFETSSAATSFTLHELAYNQKIQKKVQEEIDNVLLKHNNQLTYDAIKQMSYLDCTLKESMRIFPPVGFISRKCTRKYVLRDLNLEIDKGVAVVIPVKALHNDAKYFDNPGEFRPERFLEEQFENKHKYTYLPFGQGPRSCVGNRLGLMQSTAVLAAVLSEFTVEPASNTVRYPEVEPKANLVQSIRGGLPLRFRRRN